MSSTVFVVATTAEGTRAALQAAVPLAKGSGARLAVVVPHIASFDLAPEDPGSIAFVKRYGAIVEELGGVAEVHAFRCQSLDELIPQVSDVKGRVVLGGPAGRWLTSPEERFANRLAAAGCHVVFVATGANTTQRRAPPPVAAVLALALTLTASATAIAGATVSGCA